ncbi:MAG: hypothetical protein M3065_06740 [Actinomycetota bacterium]|nr:hypothetical protein [Actinomycetota bacterium]
MSTTSPTTSTTTQSGGAGQVSDLLAGFAAQAGKLPAEPTPDAKVASAYALGSAVADALTWCEHGTSVHLTLVPDLNEGVGRWNLLINQITVRCYQMHAYLKDNDPPLDLSVEHNACDALHLAPATSPPDVNAAVKGKDEAVNSLHEGIVEVLWSTESALGKAYQLGRAMEAMCATPTVDRSIPVKDSVNTHADAVHKLLTTLASKLPSNAAHATDNSLRLWSASLSAGGVETPEDLLQQGWRWHEVLAGEVSGKDGLGLTDYIGAADSVAGKLRQIAGQTARRFAWLLAIAVLVAVAGVALIILDTKGTVGAGIAAVLAAFGVTWKGIGEFFGRAAAKAEDQLWAAEIDWAIAYRFTVLRHPPTDAQLSRRSSLLADDRPTKEHLVRYKQWKAAWPDINLVAPQAGN